jgi:hypothetical protein
MINEDFCKCLSFFEAIGWILLDNNPLRNKSQFLSRMSYGFDLGF